MEKPGPANTEVIRLIQQCIDNSVDGSDEDIDFDDDIALCNRLLGEQPSHSPRHDQELGGDIEGPQTGPEHASVDEELLATWDATHFEIEKLLGAGGFGIVYAARDRVTNQRVALKILRPSLSPSSGFLRRFFRESRTVQELNCEGIVRPIALGLLENNPTIVTELVDGPSLRRYLDSQGGRIPERQAVVLIGQVARTLQYMHERGVLHRDLKPANILLKPTADESALGSTLTPVIADFGLAKNIDSETLTNVTGFNSQRVMGTLQYMAPEQARGARDQVSTLSDLYSLAVILYECLVGVVPNRGQSHVEVLMAMLQSEPIPVRRINSSLSRDVDLVLQRALAVDPRNRYSSVAEFANDLDNILSGKPINARKPSAMSLARTWVKQNPVLASLSLGTMCMLMVSCTTFGALYYRERMATDRYRDLMTSTLNSVKLHVEIAEDVLANVPASAEQRYEMHKSALELLQSLARGLNYDRKTLYRLSVQFSYLSKAAAQSHRIEESLTYRRECLKIIEELLQDEPNNLRYLYDQFFNRKSLADHSSGQPLMIFLKMQENLVPLIQRLRRMAPDNADYQDAEAAVLFKIGETRAANELPNAESMLSQAIRISDELFAKYPDKLLFSKYAITGRAALADWARGQRDLQKSAEWNAQGIRIVDSIDHPSKHDYWFVYLIREIYRSNATTLVYQRRWAEAIPALSKCLEIEDKLSEFDPKAAIHVIGKAEYLAELLRARRKVGLSLDEDSRLLSEVNTQIVQWKASGERLESLHKVIALLEDPDAPPVQAGNNGAVLTQGWIEN